jgi:hypothetical protein
MAAYQGAGNVHEGLGNAHQGLQLLAVLAGRGGRAAGRGNGVTIADQNVQANQAAPGENQPVQPQVTGRARTVASRGGRGGRGGRGRNVSTGRGDPALTEVNAIRRGQSYTAVEDMILSRSFMEVSEDSVIGNSQSGAQFKKELWNVYSRRLDDQFEADQRFHTNVGQGSREAMARVNGGFNIPVRYPERNPDSLYDRFKKHISHRSCKFIAITEVTERPSGSSDEDLYQLCNNIYQRRHNLGSFDDLRACCDYLKTKAKFIQWRGKQNALAAAPRSSRPAGSRRAQQQEQESRLIRDVVRGVG